MHCKNFGEMSSDDRHKVYFRAEEDRHEYGLGILVHIYMVSAVLGCRTASSRLNSIRLRAASVNVTIIQVYAPTSGHEDKEVDNIDFTVTVCHRELCRYVNEMQTFWFLWKSN